MNSRHESVVIRTAVRLLIPFVQIYGLYVIMHGHTSPGGGFQGGVILGASFILLALAFGLKEMQKRFSERIMTMFTGSGVFIYGFIGLLCLLLGANFLDYGILPIPEPRGMGMLGIEIGVGITVMAVMVSIYSDLVSFE